MYARECERVSRCIVGRFPFVADFTKWRRREISCRRESNEGAETRLNLDRDPLIAGQVDAEINVRTVSTIHCSV